MLLEDGTRFDGLACGADTHAVGEIVFTTSMSGYQEAMTDPSYAGQLITFTYPQIGNYGVNEAAMESDRDPRPRRDHARRRRSRRRSGSRARLAELAARTACRRSRTWTPARSSSTSATRARCAGACSRRVCPRREARALIDAEPPMGGRDLAREVTPAAAVSLDRSLVEGPVIRATRGLGGTNPDRDDRHRRQDARSFVTFGGAAPS